MTQWEALALLLIGISVNQLRSIPAGTNAFGLPVTAIAYAYTLIFVSLYRLVSSFLFILFRCPNNCWMQNLMYTHSCKILGYRPIVCLCLQWVCSKKPVWYKHLPSEFVLIWLWCNFQLPWHLRDRHISRSREFWYPSRAFKGNNVSHL